MSREKILKELEIQEKIQGSIPDKNLIIKLLNTCTTHEEFRTFVDITFYSYGKYSYQCHRFYSIKPKFRDILIKDNTLEKIAFGILREVMFKLNLVSATGEYKRVLLGMNKQTLINKIVERATIC